MEDEKKKSKLKFIIPVIIIMAIVIILIIFLVIKNNDTTITEETISSTQESIIYNSIGDTILLYSNELEFTLTYIDFADYYYNKQNNLFLTKCESNEKEKKSSENEKTFILFQAKVKYLGKEKVNLSGIGGFMTLDYNNGYIFKPQNVYLQQNDTWKNTVRENETSTSYNTITFEPLDENEYICRGYFEVPKEVENNTNMSLILNIEQTDVNYKFDIR